MLEIYSKNQTIPATTGIIPFTAQALKKGCTAELNGTNTIQPKKCRICGINLTLNTWKRPLGLNRCWQCRW